MKKTILAALAALTFVSPASALELPEGVTCTTLFWQTKTMWATPHLTDYEECVIATNWPNKESGILNQKAWVKIEGKFYSMHLNILRKSAKNKDEALALFNRYVLEQHYLGKEN